jgi:hypothetical protein
VPIAGGEEVALNGPLVTGGRVWEYILSPDGRGVTYVADQDAAGRAELYATVDESDNTSLAIQIFLPMSMSGK